MTDYRVNRWLDPDHDFGVQLDDTPEALAAKLYDDPWYWKHRPGLWTGMDEAAKASEWHDMYASDFARAVAVSGKRLLDAGAGVGAYARPWTHNHGCEVHAIDVSSFGMDLAAKVIPADRVHVGSVHDLSMFPDQFFDVYFTSETIEHVPLRYHYRMMAEAQRVTKIGGLIYAQGDMKIVDYLVPKYHTDPGHVAMLPPGYWRDMLLHFGFELGTPALRGFEERLRATKMWKMYREHWQFFIGQRVR